MDRPREELTGALARSSSDLRSVAQDEFGIDAEQIKNEGIPTDETEPRKSQVERGLGGLLLASGEPVGDFISGPFVLPLVALVVGYITYYVFFTKEAENAFYYSSVNEKAFVSTQGEAGFDFRALKPDMVEDRLGGGFDRLIREKLEGQHTDRTHFKNRVQNRAQGHLSWQWQALDALLDGSLAMWEVRNLPLPTGERTVGEDVQGATLPLSFFSNPLLSCVLSASDASAMLRAGRAVVAAWVCAHEPPSSPSVSIGNVRAPRSMGVQQELQKAQTYSHPVQWLPLIAGLVLGGLCSVAPIRAADLVNGEALFDANCVSNGKFSLSAIERQVWQGQAPMPSFSKLGEKNVEDLASFVYAEAEVNWKDKKLLGGEARRFSQFLDSLWPLK
eukprot:g9317.t1